MVMRLGALGRRVAAYSALLVMPFLLQVSPAQAIGAFAIGQCGAYGEAFDYATQAAAIAAARKHCDGHCTTVTMRHACAALSIDMRNPCGAYGYAVAPRISTTLNRAMRKCYDFGGKDCVIRAWACDGKG